MFEQKFATVPLNFPHFVETERAVKRLLSYMLQPQGNQYLIYLNPPELSLFTISPMHTSRAPL